MLKNFFLFFLFFLPLYAANPSLEEMIAQMIVVGFDGQKEGDKWVEQIAKDIKRTKIGGVIIDGKNIQNSTQLKKLTNYLKAQTISLPLIVIAEQEGGNNSIFEPKKGFSSFPSAQEMANTKDIDESALIYTKMSEELFACGVNVNFSPVLDLSPKAGLNEPQQSSRRYSSYEEIITTYATLLIQAQKKAHIRSVVKYFPTAGSNLVDDFNSEVNMTQNWRFEQLKPYYDLIAFEKVDAVVMSHIMQKDIDDKFPALMSSNMIQKLLREKMHFEGVVFVDNLRTSSISPQFDFKQRIIKSVNAGADILVFSNYFADNASMPFAVQKILLDAVKTGEISNERILLSYTRIKAFKEKISQKKSEL
ncbi:MAG: glycoside hydrolase family 3 N-terminal domain-containing protein [Sulfurospirillaceae bacterium]|nr:glycoside hydrolase family 3 N-terminal domain-containing protein [Sulfurospirillaceae bacterium]MDD2826238.1 glycoside hydrolase family 3 N-terminal domain-containing protein [Sulfurospirillaceae bacterium]